MLFTVPSTGGFKKTILFSGFKNPYKKQETRKLESEKKPETLTGMPFKNSISVPEIRIRQAC
jgi:hypothetical protein